jgi:transposase
LAKFLFKHHASIFNYLRHPGMDATNWRGEQAIRFGVVNRKVWGGNRTWSGARTQGVLMSVMQTCAMRGFSPITFLANALTSTTPLLLPATMR